MPTVEHLRRAMSLATRPAELDYFFDHLISAEWIEPLRSEGILRHPPGPEQRGDLIALPPWSVSRYLARVAAQAPESVMRAIGDIPETDNVFVLSDLLDAALAMPVSVAAGIVPRARRWVRAPYRSLLPEKLGLLVRHLAEGGELSAATRLARALLVVEPDERGGSRVRALYTDWEYRRMLQAAIPALIEAGGLAALDPLLDALDHATRISTPASIAEADGDLSEIERPDVGVDEEVGPVDVWDALVSAARRAVEQVIRADAALLPAVIHKLESHRWPIFVRIGLHALRLFGESQQPLVDAHLADARLFSDSVFRTEYEQLAERYFGVASEDAKAAVLGWIEDGPDLGSLADRLGREPTSEERDSVRKRWQVERMRPFLDGLPPESRARYEELVREVGSPKARDRSKERTTWIGPTSPLTADEIRSMDIPTVLEYLATWVPPTGIFEHSPEGLGRSLTAAVEAEPGRYSSGAAEFIGQDPTYVRALLYGLRKTAKQPLAIDWGPVVELCRWVIGQPEEAADAQSDRDPGWTWTRREIAHLLEEGLEPSDNELPFDRRAEVWPIIAAVCEDPDPTPEHEARYGGENMDPVTLSINTTRGQAVHAALSYALWVRRHLERIGAAELGFGAMEEVVDVLERHVDLTVDPSVSVHSVYGMLLPQLVLLDPAWVSRRFTAIFPPEGQELGRRAAWEAYVTYSRPYIDVFRLAESEYEAAIDRLGSAPQWNWLHSPDERLAEHLIVFLWSGVISLEDPNGLLSRFFAAASDELRASAIEFVGRSLQSNEEVPADITAPLSALWAARLDAGSVQIDQSRKELASFGWWFSAKSMDPAWALEQLQAVLLLGVSPEPLFQVLPRLASLASTAPAAVIRCAGLIVELAATGWELSAETDELQTVIRSVHESGGADERRRATELAHRLGSLGFRQFRELAAPP